MINQSSESNRKDYTGVFFGISLMIFSGILVFTYVQSIKSFEDLLAERVNEIASMLGDQIKENHPALNRESILMSRNKALKDLLSGHHDDPVVVNEILTFVDWFRESASKEYVVIGYLSERGSLLFDSESSNLVGSNNNLNIELLEIARAYGLSSNNLQVRIDSISSGEYYLFLSRALKMRGVKGTVVAVSPIRNLFDFESSDNISFCVSDRASKNIIFESPFNIPNSKLSKTQVNDFDLEYELISTTVELDSPPWTIDVDLNAEPYLDEPIRTGRITLLVSMCFVVACATIIRNLLKRIRNHNKKMEAELATAHNMQMGLMPKESPDLNGFRISGFCRPATEVGGDFFQYYPTENGRLSIVMADVTGHGMEAAIPTVLFSGILDNQMESAVAPEDLFGRLNRSLCRNLDARTFVCCTFGEINPEESSIRVINGGCPYPYHFKNSTQSTEEIILDAFPLGLRKKSQYEISDRKLEKGDRVVFCSDGIVEVHDESENMFGFDRTRDMINRLSANNLTANEIVNGILEEVDSFRGSAAQDDDQTIVVVEVV